jgi:predicted small metal-binding protein
MRARDNRPAIEEDRLRASAEAKEDQMAYVINCDCGFVVRAENEDELVANAEQHIRDAHPDMIDKLTREDFLAMAEEQ